MAIVDQKQRYRRQAALCYEIAATAAPAQATSMIRLGDTYAALAMDPDRLPPSIFVPTEKYAKPDCKKCGSRMQLIYSFPRTRTLPSMQAFRCDPCGETLIWKSARPSLKSAEKPSASAVPKEGDRWITRHVAVSFRQVGADFAPGLAIECPDDSLAIQRAELMLREEHIAGAIAFSRRNDPISGEAEDAVILEIFGEIPEDFDIA
jgi:predicted RNA-binding Zn-ribbon protein involved in translation (DUF1610 family)